MKLTRDDIAFLRSLRRSELEEYLAEIAESSPTAADQIREAVFRDLVTRQEVADFFGIAVDTIDLWKRKGMPYEGKSGVESQYDLGKVAKWLAHQKVVKLGGAEESEQALKEEKLLLAEIKRKQLEGTLVDRDKLLDALLKVINGIRNGVHKFHKQYGDGAVDMLTDIVDEAVASVERDL